MLEAVLLDCLLITVIRKSFKKFQPRIINYGPHKNFSYEKSKFYLLNELIKEDFINNVLKRFAMNAISMNVLNKHAPRKKKIVRGNQMPFMTKDFPKEIIKKSRLRNRFSKNKSLENRMLYKQQRNYCVSLLKKTKIRHYANLKEKKILDNKQFWKVAKPLFSDKSISGDQINLKR